MRVPLTINFRKVKHSDSIEELIREKVAKLEKMCGDISSCNIAIEKTQKEHEGGYPYRVRLDMTVSPGHEIVVKREENKGGGTDDTLSSEINEVFNAASNQLRKIVGMRRDKGR